jgi:Fur family ferric uptake transcriptional regulator
MERKTRQNEAIYQVIATAGRPLLAQEILTVASREIPHISLATVYRNIKALQEASAIRSVQLPGQNPRYELVRHNHQSVHHHYFQCRQCERVFDVAMCPGNLEQLAPTGFVVEDHEIILYGRCVHCISD